jgi:hypothetical protein
MNYDLSRHGGIYDLFIPPWRGGFMNKNYFTPPPPLLKGGEVVFPLFRNIISQQHKKIITQTL